mmetsp:Transcript_21854/g.51551  ORF Transcript_21854/g.51551 Transcript_21854/m.51551 type:complete len:437 (+) Transcript_21854:876-2186(+)
MMTRGPQQHRRDSLRQHSTAASTTATTTNNKTEEKTFVGIDPIMAPATYALEMQQQQKSLLLCRKKSKEDLDRDGDCDCDSDSSCGESSKRRRITSSMMMDEKNFLFRHSETTPSSRSTSVSATTATASSTTASSSYSSSLNSSAARRRPFDMTELIRVSNQQQIATADSSSWSSERDLLPFPIIEWNVSDDDDDDDDDDNEKEEKGDDFDNNEIEEYSSQYISSSRSSLCNAQQPTDSTTSRSRQYRQYRQYHTTNAASRTHAFLDRLFASRSASAPDFTTMSLLSMTIDHDINLAERREASLKILLGGGRRRNTTSSSSSSSSLNALHPSRLVGTFLSAPPFAATKATATSTTRKTTTKRINKHSKLTIPSVSTVTGNRFPHLVRSIVWDSHLSLLAEDFDDTSRHENDHDHSFHRRRPRPIDDFVLLPETSFF